MKTPREILFQRHEAAGTKLDAIRREVLDRELRRAGQPAAAPQSLLAWWRGFLRDYRGQLAAMSAVWLLVIFMHLGQRQSTGTAAALAAVKIPSSQVVLTALRENRLQLLELIRSPESHPAQAPEFIPNRPRSARQYEIIGV